MLKKVHIYVYIYINTHNYIISLYIYIYIHIYNIGLRKFLFHFPCWRSGTPDQYVSANTLVRLARVWVLRRDALSLFGVNAGASREQTLAFETGPTFLPSDIKNA